MPRLNFHPARNGYHFVNSFVNQVLPNTPFHFETHGLCGGMAMSALDYWRIGIAIPTHMAQDFGPEGLPAEGSRMRSYIFDRQMNFLLTKLTFLRWLVMPWVRPEDYHNWATGSEFEAVKKQIDQGRPALLGLLSMEGLLKGTHQVLCYGYDTAPIRLYIYDPNHPDQECTLVPVSAEDACQMRFGDAFDQYRGYFLADVYNWDEPPYTPRYYDLSLSHGLSLNPDGDNVGIGRPMDLSVKVRNAGDYPARFRQVYIWVRGPQGENLDHLFGCAEAGLTALDPGEERLIVRHTEAFGTCPGEHVVGIAFLSLQDQVHDITAGPPGTSAANRVILRRQTHQVCDTTVTVRESDFDVDTNVQLEPGDDYMLSATGQIWAGVWLTGQNGPEGWTDRVEQNPRFPLHDKPDAHPFSLLGRFGSGGYFYVGRGVPRTRFGEPAPCRLFLRINDDTPGNGTGAFQCRVQVWRHQGPVLVVPQEPLDFHQVSIGSSRSASLAIENIGPRPVMVTLGVAPLGPFTVQPATPTSVVAGSRLNATVLFTPTVAGAAAATATVAADDPDTPPVQVALRGIGVQAPPTITLSPRSLEFGQVIVGRQYDGAFRVSNTGSSALDITDVVQTGDTSFEVVDYPRHIPCAASGTIRIQCLVHDASLHVGEIQISSNDPRYAGQPLRASVTALGIDVLDRCSELAQMLAELESELEDVPPRERVSVLRQIRAVKEEMRRLGCHQ